MSTPAIPQVLVIDDDPESQRAVFRLADRSVVLFDVVHPDEVTEDALNRSDLVLVDYVIDSWPARDAVTQICLRPVNGIALASILRERANQLARPTGFAIQTGQPEAFSITPAEPRAHLLARTHNLEWVFTKSDSQSIVRQATVLAQAIRELPATWPGEDRRAIERIANTLLGLESAGGEAEPQPWLIAALEDVNNCRPPLTELAERNHGLLFLRWLLQRIIPYPCFLYDTHYLAVRLQVTHSSLLHALNGNLASWLEPCLYRGIVAGFLGHRWWRAAVEHALWRLAGNSSIPATDLRLRLAETAHVALEASPMDEPIVCIDQNYQEMDEACSARDVIRVQPDDWPPYAGQAWAPIRLARDEPRLNAIVALEDRDRIE